MSGPDKMTPLMLKVLSNLAAGKRSDDGMPSGRSFSGGLNGTFAGLRRRGLIDHLGDITDAGRAALTQKETP